MEIDNTVEALTPEDIDILKNRYEKPNLRLAVFVVMFIAGASFASYHMNSLIPVVSTVIFFGILAAFYIWVMVGNRKQIAIGRKTVYSGIIDKKREADYGMERSEDFSSSTHIFCFFTISGKEFVVPADSYEQFKEGDRVRLHATMPDCQVFKVTPA